MKSNEAIYHELLVVIKQQIRSVQVKAALAVNASLIQLNWNIGRMIAENQALFEGRNNYVNQLVKDLRLEFPGTTGFSRSNLFSIRKFYQFYLGCSVQQLVGLEEFKCDVDILQQDNLLNINKEEPGSVQQLVGLKSSALMNLLIRVPWGIKTK